jgi:hypothetical protein
VNLLAPFGGRPWAQEKAERLSSGKKAQIAKSLLCSKLQREIRSTQK